MAGIGFRITRMMRGETLAGALGAFTLATIIGSGAWILSVASLAVLAALLDGSFFPFFAVIAHAFAISLIIMGPVQMVLSRHAADLGFMGKSEQIFPAFLGAMALSAPVSAAIGSALFSLAGGTPLFRLMAVSVFVVVSWIWIASAYVSGSKNHMRVVASYAVGYGVAIVTAWRLGLVFGNEGAVAGFLLGNMLLLALIAGIVSEEYGHAATPDFSFLRMFRTHGDVALCGLFYNIGLWADKFIIWWFSPFGEKVSGHLRGAPFYDFSVSFALIAIIPGMAVFLVTLESDFAAKHHEFLMKLNHNGTLGAIREAREVMAQSLKESLFALCRVQGCTTLACVVGVLGFADEAGLDAVHTDTLLIMFIAMGGLTLAMSLLTVLFYLDRRREALICCAVFAGVNIVGTGVLAGLTGIPNAYGFAASILATIFCASHYANKAIGSFEHLVFASQVVRE